MAFESARQQGQADQQKIAEITNFIATDPQIQQWRAEAAAQGNQFVGPEAKQKIEDRLASQGMQLPDGYVIQQNGTPVKDAGFDWKPIIGMGALVTGGLLGPALAGAADPLSSGALTSNFIDPGIIGGAAGGTAPLAEAGGTIAGMLGPSTPENIAATGAAEAAPDSIAGGGAAGGVSAPSVASAGSKVAKGLEDASSLLGKFATTNQNNQLNLAREQLAAQAGRNSNETDALRKLMVTNYLKNQNSGYTPPTITMGGKSLTLPNMGSGFLAPSAAQKQAAGTLEPMLTQRLAPGGSVWPQGPSTATNLANAGSLITGTLGAVNEMDPNWMSQVGNVFGKIF